LPELTASLQCVAQELKNVKAAIADSTKKLKKIETREGNEIAHVSYVVILFGFFGKLFYNLIGNGIPDKCYTRKVGSIELRFVGQIS